MMLWLVLIIGVYERYHFGPGLTEIENTKVQKIRKDQVLVQVPFGSNETLVAPINLELHLNPHFELGWYKLTVELVETQPYTIKLEPPMQPVIAPHLTIVSTTMNDAGCHQPTQPQ